MTKVIGFIGKKFHGKDSAAAPLRDSPYYYTQVNFATSLKEVCRLVYGLTYEEMSNADLKERPLNRWPWLSPREIMQHTGEALRKFMPNTWTECWKRYAEQHARVVVTDVRYPNEVEVIREMGGKLIKIVRPSVKDNEFSNHSSENQIDSLPFDVDIINDKSIQELQEEVDTIMRHFYNE